MIIYEAFYWRYFIIWNPRVNLFQLTYNWVSTSHEYHPSAIKRITCYVSRPEPNTLVVKRRNFLEVTHLETEYRKKVLGIIGREFKDIRKFELGKFDLENIEKNYVEYFIWILIALEDTS